MESYSDVGLQIHHAYADLPHIDTVRHWSEAEDGECFGDIGDVLLDAGAEGRFAITLLHQHFPIYESEIMLSCFEPEGALVTSPHNSLGLSRHCIVPSAWRLREHNGSFEPTPLEWVKATEESVLRLLLTPADLEIFSKLGKVLKNHNALKRFGFRLAEVVPLVGQDMLVVETTYLEDRTLELAPEPSTASGLDNAIQTSWQIIETEQPYQAGFWCKKKTTSYCNAYCKTSCRWSGGEFGSHDENHKGRYHRKESDSTHYE